MIEKKKIRVRYVDFWPRFEPETSKLYKILSKEYDLVEVDKPDYIIDGGLGSHHLKYDSIKILRVGANIVPDFNCFDYAIGYDLMTFGDRYARIPSYTSYDSYKTLYGRTMPSDKELLNRGFCSFVVSNPTGNPIRELFFRRLSKYKKVDSGGRWLNNVGGPIKDKLDFCRRYKFNICFENSSALGYTTEKLMQALAANTVPIYYGNPLVTEDFRAECMICLKDEEDVERTVEEIIRLDNDDDAYLVKCKSPCLVKEDADYYDNLTLEFFRHIFEQPIDKARRLNDFGYQADQRRRTKYALLAHQFARDSFWFVYELLHGKIRRITT